MNGTLWAANFSWSTSRQKRPVRGPTILQPTSAPTPPVRWQTPEPAKSMYPAPTWFSHPRQDHVHATTTGYTNDVITKQKMQYPPSWRRSATAPLTIVADVMQKAHWKNQFKLPEEPFSFRAFVITPSSPNSMKVVPTEANSERPMKPFSGTSPYANPQPKSHQPRVLTQQFSRFFSSTDCENPARQQPHSNIANPACMNITRAPQRMSHMCVMATSWSTLKDSIMVCNSAAEHVVPSHADVLCPAASIARMRPSAAED